MQDDEDNGPPPQEPQGQRKRIDAESAMETIRAIRGGAYAPFGSLSLVRAVTRQKRSEPS